ncbi:MAG: carboxypeptidase regulatory-like domain-containing protein [Patescibacteria group bacterium]
MKNIIKKTIGWVGILAILLLPFPTMGISVSNVQTTSVRGILTAPDGLTAISSSYVYIHNLNWSVSNGTYTGSDGSFAFIDLPSGDYVLEISQGTTAYPAPDPIDVMVISGQTTDLGNVRLKNPNVRGRLIIPGENVGVAGVYVYLNNNSAGIYKYNYSDNDGYFNLYSSVPGDYTLQIYNSSDYNSITYWPPNDQTITIIAGKTTNVGNINFNASNVVGTVTEPDGTTPVSYASVTIRDDNWYFSRSVSTDINGEFSMYVPTSGTYYQEVWAYSDDYSNPDLRKITINTAVTTDLSISLVQPNIVGRVTLPDKVTGVSGVSVDLHNSNWSVSRWANTDNDGYFRMYLSKTGTYTISFWYYDNDYSPPDSYSFSYTIGQTKNLSFTLQAPAMKGKIQKPDGSAAAYASINLHDAGYSYDGSKWSSTDSEGVFKVDSVPTGTYTMEISPPWDSSTDMLVTPEPVSISLTKGTTNNYYYNNPIRLSYAKKTIRGTVLRSNNKPVANAQISAWKNNGGGWASTTTNADGEFSFKVGQGKWQVNVYPQEWPPDWGYYKTPKTVEFTKSNDTAESKTVEFVVSSFTATLKGYIKYPDGTIPPQSDYVSVNAWSMEGGGNWTNVNSKGYFEMKLPAGTFSLDIYSNNNAYGAPDMQTITLAETDVLNLGTVKFVEKNEFITGKVTDANGNPLASQWVNAWKFNGSGWASSETDENGDYSLSVTPGTWMVDSWPSWSENTVYVRTQEPQQVVLTAKETESNVNFQFAITDATIRGTVQDKDGNVLDDMNGWAFAEKDNQTRGGDMWYSGLGGNINMGSFAISVPAGRWRLGANTWGSDYSPSGDTIVNITSGQTIDNAVITLLENDAIIAGDMVDADGNKVDVWGSVFAENGAGAYQWSDIENGSYSLNVSAGTWNIGYWIDWASGYLDQPLDNGKIKVKSEESKTFDITLLKADSRISGTVTDSDGNPLPNAWVSADTKIGGQKASYDDYYYNWYNRGKITDQNGNYSMQVPAGSYFVSASLPPDMGMINPSAKKVTVNPDNPATADLQFKVANGRITGQVTLDGELNTAFVWGYSDSGGYTEYYTDDGNYSLNATKEDIWHVGAIYETSSTFYKSNKVGVQIPDSGTVEQGLVLVESDIEMPASETATFAASNTYTMSLDNGMTLFMPSYSLTTDDINVTVVASPKAGIPSQAHAVPIDYGYDLTAIKASGDNSGQTISTFAADITITIPYTDEELADLGITEDDIVPMYYDETAGSYKTLENVSVDTATNTVTFTTRHFTTFAITAGASGSSTPVITLTGPEDNNIINVNSVLVTGNVSDPHAEVVIALAGASIGTVTNDSTTGAFSETVSGLVAGENTITVDASNNVGQAATITRTVTYQGGEGDISGIASGIGLDMVLQPTNGSSHLQVYDNQGNLKASFFAYNEDFRGDFQVETADIDGDGSREIITIPGKGSAPHLRVFTSEGELVDQFYTYDAGFRGGVEMVIADVNGDNVADIITKPKSNGGSNIRVYEYNSTTEKFELMDWFMAYHESFRGEVNIVVSDVTGDGQNDIIVSPKEEGGPNVRIYTYNTATEKIELIDWFMAYQDIFRGGVNIAAADIDGDGIKDIVTAPAADGGPNVRVYKYNSTTGHYNLLDHVMAYQTYYRGGIKLKLADVNSDGKYEIITNPTSGGPNIRVYTYNDVTKNLELLDWLWVYPASYRGGQEIFVADVDNDNNVEIVTTPNTGGPNIRLYEYDPGTGTFKQMDWFMAYHPDFRGGVNLKVADIDGDGDSDLITTPASNGGPNVRIYKWDSSTERMDIRTWFMAFSEEYRLGLEVGTIN